MLMRASIGSKIERLQQGKQPRVLDLFSGCGGLSLGFQAAGFRIAGAMELDRAAAATHTANLGAAVTSRDITETSPAELIADLELGLPELAIDVVVGGPPCQAFARIGRAKLAQVLEHPEAYLRDPRGNLYLHLLKHVHEMQPLVVLIENVPEFLDHGGHNVAEEISEALESDGYVCGYTILNAVHYGVPQFRDRVFVLAYAEELGAKIEFPRPTNRAKLPPGYEGVRTQVGAPTNLDLFADRPSAYRHPPRPERALRHCVTVGQAISDLEAISPDENGPGELFDMRAARRAPYGEPVSSYAWEMRSWQGFEAKDAVEDHVIRRLPRDYPIFRRMKEGDQYPQAHRIAVQAFQKHLAELATRGIHLQPESEAYLEERRKYVPPYSIEKFANKWWKMRRGRPSRTLTAHLGKDSYSHIHHAQPRTISVREAARLQSFPDGFVFKGGMNDAFKQIGNAVPPLLAKALAEQVRETLGRSLARACLPGRCSKPGE